MSSWSNIHKGAGNGSALDGVKQVFDDFAGSRILLECLTGIDVATGQALGACKMTLFYEFGRLKLCITDDVKGRLGFTTIDGNGGSIGEAIERALEAGIDWRAKPKRPEGGGGQWRK